MLAAYLSGAAYVFAGQPEEGAPRVVRALELLESEPSLRDDPRHLSLALLCARWLLDPGYVVGGVTVVEIGWRRIRSARSQGALGSLALGLSLAAGGLAWFGDHIQAYAMAGEAVELLDVLGFRADRVWPTRRWPSSPLRGDSMPTRRRCWSGPRRSPGRPGWTPGRPIWPTP